MGAKGIKRRKPYRKLPPARAPADDEGIPPNVMWPTPESGFEASPWSPAGRNQAAWAFVRGLGRSDRYGMVSAFLWVIIALLALVVLSSVLAMVL